MSRQKSKPIKFKFYMKLSSKRLFKLYEANGRRYVNSYTPEDLTLRHWIADELRRRKQQRLDYDIMKELEIRDQLILRLLNKN
jgi:hypothetical protein